MRNRYLVVGAIVCILLFGLVLPLMPTQAQDNTWQGEYFQNPNLSGKPDFIRQDVVISFDWGDAPPNEIVELVSGWSGDHFSIRWTKTDFFVDDTYIFAARADDGVRMYVDGVRIIDEWHHNQFQWYAVERKMSRGNHLIVVEYYEDTGRAAIQAGYYPKHPLPTNTPKPTATKSPTPGPSPTPTKTNTPSPPRPTRTPSLLGTPGKLPTAVETPPPASDAGGIIVEDGYKPFLWTGFPGVVFRSGGHEGSYAYIKNHSAKPLLQAQWLFEPPQAGYYDVYAYIPKNSLATTAAVYRVFHNNQLSGGILVDQSAYSNDWVYLGSFYFLPGKPQYITLTNVTGEPTATREVMLDAMMFIFKP